MNDKKFLIIGGHMTPALALLHKLQAEKQQNIVWVGHKYAQTNSTNESAEYKLITSKNIKFINLRTGKVWRKINSKTWKLALNSFVQIPLGFMRAFWIILRERPKVIVSFGGYLAVPLVISAWILRIPSITHEQTITVGLANKIIAKFANQVLISWQDTRQYFPASKTIFTGNPIRREVLEVTTTNYQFARNLPLLLIMGGNQGSHAINSRILPIIKTTLKDFNIVHITGNSSLTTDHQEAIALKQSLPQELTNSYIVKESVFGAEIGELINKADLMITRAGANTVTEQLVLGKRAILVPIPWASQNEQYKNAKILEELGLGIILEQNEQLTSQSFLAAIDQASKAIANKTAFNGRAIKDIIKQAEEIMPGDSVERIYAVISAILDNS